MMDEFKVTRDEARYCRAKAIDRHTSLHPDNLCKWDKAGPAKNRAENWAKKICLNQRFRIGRCEESGGQSFPPYFFGTIGVHFSRPI